jgi:hypothetical protein
MCEIQSQKSSHTYPTNKYTDSILQKSNIHKSATKKNYGSQSAGVNCPWESIGGSQLSMGVNRRESIVLYRACKAATPNEERDFLPKCLPAIMIYKNEGNKIDIVGGKQNN